MKKCVFKNKKGECSVLKETKCHECNFCKTKEELDEGRRKSNLRLRKLSEEFQRYIAERYHKGKMVW